MRINRRELLAGAATGAIAAGLPENLKALTPQQRAALPGGAENGDFPYPSFPFTTLNRQRLASDLQPSTNFSVSDVASTDNPYGQSTSARAVVTSSWVMRPSFITTGAGVDVRGGQIRFNFKPITTIKDLTRFELDLFSSTTVGAAGSNYHKVDIKSLVGLQTTSNGAASGRWQSVGVDVSSTVVANGAGADLTNIRQIQVQGTGACQFEIGDFEFVPNPRSKGAVIIRADDGDASQYTILKPAMDAFGAVGVIMPSPISTVIGGGGHLKFAQWQAMMAAGWQNASQAYSTENNTIVDSWTRQQRLDEYAAIRSFVAPYGHRRDTYDGSYYSSVGPNDMIAWPELRDSFRTLCSFRSGNASGNPFPFSEVFPFGDPKNIQCLNLNSWGDVSDIYESHMILALDQTRAAKGVLVVAFHNEMGLPSGNHLSALNKIGNYVTALHPDTMEFTTIRKLLAPYNGDTLTG